jgi:hypothetical protein
MSSFTFTNSSGLAFQVQGPPGATYDQALAIFNQQYNTGGLVGIPVGGLLNAVTQAEGGLSAAAAQIGPQAVALAAEIGNNTKLPSQLGMVPGTKINVSEFLNTGVGSQSIGDVSQAQIQGLVATTAATVDQSANVITATKGLGTYGLTAEQLQVAGLIKPGIADQVKQDPANAVSILSSPTSWTGKQGVTDINAILDDVNIQTSTQQTLMSNSYEQLKENGTLNGNESADTVGPLVNAATKYGVANTTQWLNNNTVTTGNNPISSFINSSSYGSTFGVKNQNIAAGIGVLSLGIVVAKGYTNTVNRQNVNQATAAVIGNSNIVPPRFPSSGASAARTSDAAAQSAVQNALTALSNVGDQAKVVEAINKELSRSGGQQLSVGYNGILRTADGAAVLSGDGKPVTIGGDSPTLGSGITSADKAAMFGGGVVNFGAATTTSGQNATPAPGQSVSQTISTSLASLRDTAVNNPAATKVALNIALSAFPALGAIIAVASFFAKNIAPAVAPATNETAAETDRLARFAEEAQAREAEAEAAQRQTDSEGKSERAAQFGGPDADADGSYSNSLRDSPSDAGADSGP